MKASKTYDKIGAVPLPSHDAPYRCSTKRARAVLVTCSVALFVATGCVAMGLLWPWNTHHHKSGPSGIRSPDLIEKVCNNTFYVKVCNSSLSASPGALQANASEIAIIAVEVSRDEAEETRDFTLNLNRTAGYNASGSSGPLGDCVELLCSTLDTLNASLAVLESPDWRRRMDDVKTWLSAALTNPSTCAEGFEEVGVSIPPRMTQKMEYLMQLTSNALAVVNYVSATENGTNISQTNRRLMIYRSHFLSSDMQVTGEG